MEKLTPEEKKLQDERVLAVKKEIEAEAELRETNEVKETAAEKKAREESEDSRLEAAKEGSGEANGLKVNVHRAARDARVAAVVGATASAKLAREAKEKEGIAETPGAKLDREAKEKKDLEEARKLNVIEPFFNIEDKPYGNNFELDVLAKKLSEVIARLNKREIVV